MGHRHDVGELCPLREERAESSLLLPSESMLSGEYATRTATREKPWRGRFPLDGEEDEDRSGRSLEWSTGRERHSQCTFTLSYCTLIFVLSLFFCFRIHNSWVEAWMKLREFTTRTCQFRIIYERILPLYGLQWNGMKSSSYKWFS